MKKLLLIILAIINTPVFGQNAQCFCSKNKQMNGATISCDTTLFSNKSEIYWQYNCDSIWLTLENKLHQKFIIDKVPVVFYPMAGRLGFHLIKEYKKTLLFRTGCASNGPCEYVLIDKFNGKKITKFDQLICIDTDMAMKNPHKYQYDFVVYLTYKNEKYKLVVYFVNSGRKITTPFTDKLTGLIPAYQFDKMDVKKNVLSLWYKNNSKMKKVEIDLKNENTAANKSS